LKAEEADSAYFLRVLESMEESQEEAEEDAEAGEGDADEGIT
jgi:hypothetical protein